MVFNVLTVFESLLVALLLRFEGLVPIMYWVGFLLLGAISVVLFLACQNYQGDTLLAAIAELNE
jgi:hypothetical protein